MTRTKKHSEQTFCGVSSGVKEITAGGKKYKENVIPRSEFEGKDALELQVLMG